jgi:hypothetical protein
VQVVIVIITDVIIIVIINKMMAMVVGVMQVGTKHRPSVAHLPHVCCVEQ